MSYKTYITEALVCGSVCSNTSDKSYLLFSKEAGMLWATARSVREERSKQRSALQDFSYIRVSLVKGKSGWRIGSTEAHGNSFLQARSRTQRALIRYVLLQLRRYVHGEIPLQRTYDDVLEILIHSEDFEKEYIRAQRIFLLRLLFDLGYIAPEATLEPLFRSVTVAGALAQSTAAQEHVIEHAIDTGMQASHL